MLLNWAECQDAAGEASNLWNLLSLAQTGHIIFDGDTIVTKSVGTEIVRETSNECQSCEA